MKPGSSTTNNRPFSSNAIATGALTSGSPATNSILKPGLIRKEEFVFVGKSRGTIAGFAGALLVAGAELVEGKFVPMIGSAALAANHPAARPIVKQLENIVQKSPSRIPPRAVRE
jgi:hypothetical protein